jgi:hypothetical protein
MARCLPAAFMFSVAMSLCTDAADAAGRFHVIACSEPQTNEGAAGNAHRQVRALRRAGFDRSHVLDSAQLPQLAPGFWICLVVSFAHKRQAYVVANDAEKKGFPAYVALAW